MQTHQVLHVSIHKEKTDLDSLILRFPHSSGQVFRGLLTLAELRVYNETLKHKYIWAGLDFIMDVLNGCNARVNSDVLGTFHPKIAAWKKKSHVYNKLKSIIILGLILHFTVPAEHLV